MTSLTSTLKQPVPPGPAGFARVTAIQFMRRNPLAAMQTLARTYGDMVYVNLGPYHVYLLNHPDFLHEILVRQADKMRKPRTLTRPIVDFLGNGLLVSHGEYWKQQRRTIQPAFRPQHTPAYSQIMVDGILQHIGNWEAGHIYDVDHEFMKMTLQMVTQALFGSRVTESGDHIADAVKILQRVSYQQGQAPLAVPTRVPLPGHLAKQRAIRLLDKVVVDIVRAARSRTQNDGTLLTMLLTAVDVSGAPLTDQQVRDEVMTVLLAGHESTANAIGWMFYLLAQNPDAENKLRLELNEVLGKRSPTADDLRKLSYTAMIVKEALRLYPPAWALPREALEDTEIGGYPVRKGSLLFGVPFIIQRDARYFEQPDQFRPERFANNAEKNLPRHVYLPFGAGPRFCVGNTFALLAMQLTLVTIYQHYCLELVPDQPIVLDPLLTLRPRHGIHMRIHPI